MKVSILHCIFFPAFIAALCSNSSAQTEIKYFQYSSEKGLSENVVYCLHKDKRGFMWVGTDYGLNRFDGYNFRKYYSIPGDSNSLSNSSIVCIAEQQEGKFWIGTYEGLNLFDPETGQVTRIVNPKERKYFVVEKIELLTTGDVLAVSNREIFLYHVTGKVWTKAVIRHNCLLADNKPLILPDKQVAFFCSSHKEETLVLDEKNYKIVYKQTRQFFSFIKEEQPDYYYYEPVKREHFLFFKSAIKIFNSGGELLITSPLELNPARAGYLIYDVKRFDTASVWMATNLGLLSYNQAERTIGYVQLKGEAQSIPGNKEARCLLNDSNGSIWIGMFGAGLLRCETNQSKFSSLSLTDINGTRFNRMIFGMYRWQGDTVAAETQLRNFILIYKNRIIDRLSYHDLNLEKILLVTTGKQLAELNDLQRSRLQHLYKQKRISPFLFNMPNDTTIISFDAGISIYQPAGIVYQNEITPGNMVADKDYYWFSSQQGLLRISRKGFTDSLITFEKSVSNFYHIALDGNNDLWVGTKGDGLMHFDRTRNKFYHFSTRDGLTDNVIYMVLPDGQGNLWLTTNNGISRFHIKTQTFTNFTRQDGLSNAEFNRQGAILTEDGTIYLAGTSGIDFFNPAVLGNIQKKPSLFISEVRVNGSEYLYDGNIKLAHRQNNISIFYTANNFIRPDLIYYRYRVKGLNYEWERVQGKNQLELYALPPDQYEVEIQASYNNTDWSDPVIININILPPWWRQWWFRLLLGAGLLLLLVLIIRKYISDKLFKKQVLYEKQLNILNERERIITDLHDDVGATLSSMHIYGDLADTIWDAQPAKSKEMVGKISRQSKELMARMSDIVWSLKPFDEEKNSFALRLKNYSHELLAVKNISVVIETDEQLAAKMVSPLVRKNLLLIAKEAMNNIAKYSGATQVVIKMLQQEDKVVLYITDNGKGFTGGSQTQGNGLKNMEQRCRQLTGVFAIDAVPDQGVTISCSIPIAIISHIS